MRGGEGIASHTTHKHSINSTNFMCVQLYDFVQSNASKDILHQLLLEIRVALNMACIHIHTHQKQNKEPQVVCLFFLSV
jgi:hypothetical protein